MVKNECYGYATLKIVNSKEPDYDEEGPPEQVVSMNSDQMEVKWHNKSILMFRISEPRQNTMPFSLVLRTLFQFDHRCYDYVS